MKKFKIYPLWKADELENFLKQQERDGWRLSSINCSCIFDFAPCKPKDADYIVTYDMAKDTAAGMYQCKRDLLSEYSANEIPSKKTGYSVFRVTGKNRDFADLKTYRKSYFKHVLFQYLLIYGLFPLIGLFMLLASILQKSLVDMRIFSVVFVLILLALFLYRVYGYIYHLKK